MKKLASIFAIEYNTDQRVFGLDIFRAISILLVLKAHGHVFVQPYFPSFPANIGISGPELFFVLSGYLIGQILIKRIQQSERFGKEEVIRFLKRRWWRTLPNYYLFLLFHFLILVTIQNNFRWEYLVYFGFGQNLINPMPGFFPESWSLTIEEWFYLSLPFWLMLFVNRSADTHRKDGFRRPVIKAVILYILFVFLLRLFFFEFAERTEEFLIHQIRGTAIIRLDSVMIGVLAACMKVYFSRFWYKSRYLLFLFGLILVPSIHYSLPHQSDFFVFNLHFLLKSIGAACLLSLTDTIRRAPRWLVVVITHISLVSYSMYLVNLPARGFIIYPLQKALGIGDVWAHIWFVLVTVFISTLIYKFFEKPMMNLREGRSINLSKKPVK